MTPDQMRARIEELEAALQTVLDAVSISEGVTGTSARGVWMRGPADHAGLFIRARAVLARPCGGAPGPTKHYDDPKCRCPSCTGRREGR